jgi:hypothetical protein
MNTTLGEPTGRLKVGDDPDVTVIQLAAQPPTKRQLLQQLTVAGGLFHHTQPIQYRFRLPADGAQLGLGHDTIMPAKPDNFQPIKGLDRNILPSR